MIPLRLLWLRRLPVLATLLAPGALAAQLPVTAPPPALPAIDGAPFLRFMPAFSLTRGDAEGRLAFEIGLRPPARAFGITTLARATHVMGSFQPSALLQLLGGLERFSDTNAFRLLAGVSTSTGYGWNSLALESGIRTGRLRLDVRSTRFFGGRFDPDTLVDELSRLPPPGHYTDGEIQWQLPVRGLELQTTLGARLGEGTTRGEGWGYASAAVPLPFWTGRVAAVLTAGWRPSIPELRVPGGQFVGLGMRLALNGSPVRKPPSAARPRAEAERLDVIAITGTNTRRLELRTKAERSVEVRGDFTDWNPLPLARSETGSWDATLVLEPGIYQIEMRVDGGEWKAPPGLVRVPDGYGGQVGLLEVR